MKLINGYYYDIEKNQLRHKVGKKDVLVKLTKLEQAVVDIMVGEEITEMEKFEQVVWKNRNFSRFTLRNKIKSIRDKTCNELIVNHSNVGYYLNRK